MPIAHSHTPSLAPRPHLTWMREHNHTDHAAMRAELIAMRTRSEASYANRTAQTQPGDKKKCAHLLVDLRPVVEAVLAGARDRPRDAARVPRADARDLAQASVRLARQPRDAPPRDHALHVRLCGSATGTTAFASCCLFCVNAACDVALLPRQSFPYVSPRVSYRADAAANVAAAAPQARLVAPNRPEPP